MKVLNTRVRPAQVVEKVVITFKGRYIHPTEIIENTSNIFKARWYNDIWILITYQPGGWKMMLSRVPDFNVLNFVSPCLMTSVEVYKNLLGLFEEFKLAFGKTP